MKSRPHRARDSSIYSHVRAVLIALFAAALLSGCSGIMAPQLVLMRDFASDEVFRIGNESCTMSEANVYMRTFIDRYQNILGSEIWQKDLGGTTLEDELKKSTLARLAQIKAMKILADDRKVKLSTEESSLADEAARIYIERLSGDEASNLNVDESMMGKMYREYALAEKVYDDITRDVNPEISDDEARTITVRHILIKTYSQNADGETIEYSDEEKTLAYQRAQEILEKLREGGDFDSLSDTYNEDSESEYTFGKGMMPDQFESAAFNLSTDGISDIVETPYGYHIIKCISTFDREETDENKLRIVRQRKKEAFNRVYDYFVQDLHSNLNSKLWDETAFSVDTTLAQVDFFEIYDEVFGQ